MADYFLKVDGIPGESADAKHKGEIDVLAFSWGVSQAGSPSTGGGGGAGKAVFDDLLLVARHEQGLAAALAGLCGRNPHLLRRSHLQASRQDRRTSSSRSLSRTSWSSLVRDRRLRRRAPLDQIALSYGQIETTYTPADKTGKPQPPVRAGWDVKSNKKV